MNEISTPAWVVLEDGLVLAGRSVGVAPQSSINPGGPKPDRQATGMPCRLPLGVISAVFASACASSHSTRRRWPLARQWRATALMEPGGSAEQAALGETTRQTTPSPVSRASQELEDPAGLGDSAYFSVSYTAAVQVMELGSVGQADLPRFPAAVKNLSSRKAPAMLARAVAEHPSILVVELHSAPSRKNTT